MSAATTSSNISIGSRAEPKQPPAAAVEDDAAPIGLTAVVVAVTDEEPRVLVVARADRHDALPAGPLEPCHRTLEAGLRAWVEAQTRQSLGYVEQLYTFADRDRYAADGPGEGGADERVVSIAYLALVREERAVGSRAATWQSWYRYFPWEDWRGGRSAVVDRLEPLLLRWAAAAPGAAPRRERQDRLRIAFGLSGAAWNDERVLDRYELLYEAGLVPEARRGRTVAARKASAAAGNGAPMAADHRRILATAIARLRGKIKYRPVVFELMPPTFTLLQLQRAVEALAGMRLHKQNFRRLVAQQGLVEDSGAIAAATGGRPAREVRFRREVLLERLAPGVKLPTTRPTADRA